MPKQSFKPSLFGEKLLGNIIPSFPKFTTTVMLSEFSHPLLFAPITTYLVVDEKELLKLILFCLSLIDFLFPQICNHDCIYENKKALAMPKLL